MPEIRPFTVEWSEAVVDEVLELVRRYPWPPAPAAFANFPGETLYTAPPRSWADRAYNIVRWTDQPRGGHFAAMEQPAALADEIQQFFRGLR